MSYVLQPVDVHPATREVFPVVQAKVSVAAEHERVVALVSIRIGDASPANLLDRESQNIFCPGGGKRSHEDSSLPLQNAENRDFAGGTPSLLIERVSPPLDPYIKREDGTLNCGGHRTNAGPRIGQTTTRVSDRSRYRTMVGRFNVKHTR
jgi:hypothetical protein